MTRPDSDIPDPPDQPGDSGPPAPEPSTADSVDPLLEELRARVSELSRQTPPPTEGQADDEAGRRRASAELLYQQASETRAKALREHERATQLRARLGETEAELRQAQLELEVQHERIREERAELAEQRTELADELETFEQQVAAQSARLVAAGSTRAGFLEILLRAFAIAIAAGLAAGGAWWWYNQDTVHVSEAGIALRGTDLTSASAAAELIAVSPDAFASQNQGLAWRQAIAEGRVQVEPGAGGTLSVALQGPGPVENEDLLSAAYDAFSASLINAASDRTRNVAWQTWETQRSLLAMQSEAWQQRLAELADERDEIPGEAQWRGARNKLDALRAETRALTDELDQARSALLGLQSLDLPRGTVSTDTFAAALLADPVYQEDASEMESQARTYQSEVLLGKVLVVDPLDAIRKSVRGLASAIEKQVELKPSIEVQAILEDAAAEVDDLGRLLLQFTGTWNARRQEIELLKPAEQAERLIAAQQAAFESLGRVTDEVQRVLNVLSDNVRSLGELPGGGTRENVVAAMLRGEITRITDDLREVREAGARLDPGSNFKLDAADRQVRSLRGRIRDRQERIQRELQSEADETARGDYEQTLRRQQEEISRLDEKRDTAMDLVVAQLEVLRDLEQSSRALIGLDAEKAALEREVANIESRREALLAAEPQPRVPTVALTGMRHESREASDLLRTTGIVAGVVAGTTLLAGLLMLARFTRRTDPSPLAT